LAATTRKRKKKTDYQFEIHFPLYLPRPGYKHKIKDKQKPTFFSRTFFSSLKLNWICVIYLFISCLNFISVCLHSIGCRIVLWPVFRKAVETNYSYVCLLLTGAGPDLCVVQTPLVTRHLQAWRLVEEAVPTRGCSNRSGVVATHEVKTPTKKKKWKLFSTVLWLTLEICVLFVYPFLGFIWCGLMEYFISLQRTLVFSW
jgi:hypothetical protein